MNRREALKTLGIAAGALALDPGLCTVAFGRTEPRTGTLSIANTHTGDFSRVRYLDDAGHPVGSAVEELDHLFRCHYNGKVHPIDLDLYRLLDTVQTQLGAAGATFRLISGYRSPEYNALLRSKGHHVAKNSYHLKGMAADVVLDGVPLAALRKAGLRLHRGGVGTYPEFIHLDVGPARTW